MSEIAIYPGSFDPITYGHIDIFKRLKTLDKKIIVLVTSSQNKNYLFSLDERVALVKGCAKEFPYIEVDFSTKLTVNYMTEKKIKLMIRGVRSSQDFQYEMGLHASNQALESDVETLLMLASPHWSFIRSSWIKEIAYNNGSLEKFFPKNIQEAVIQKMKQRES